MTTTISVSQEGNTASILEANNNVVKSVSENVIEITSTKNVVSVVSAENLVLVPQITNKARVVSIGTQGPKGIPGPAGVNTWGSITGILSTQTDLQTALDDKASDAELTAGLATKANTVHGHVIGDVTGLQTALDAKPEFLFDTKSNILQSSPAVPTLALATDTLQSFEYRSGDWYSLSGVAKLSPASPVDIGIEQDSDPIGYGEGYVADKLLSHCWFGDSNLTTEGAARMTYATSLARNVFQVYLAGGWKTALTGVNIQTDSTETPADIEFTDFGGSPISLISGNSDALDYDGRPIVQNMKTDMGIYQTPIIISGGTF